MTTQAQQIQPQTATTASQVSMPPRGFWRVLRQLGPGMILTGGVVGSGELIATTTVGAQVGFTALWLIIISCVIKVVVQEELARYTIITGDTTFAALNKVPGPRWRVSWVVWCWMLMFLGVAFQQGGMIGGVAQVFNLVIPTISITSWSVIVAVATMVLLVKGRYRVVEKGSTLMVVSFTIITITCAVMLVWTPYVPQWDQIAAGFTFQLPAHGLAVAFATFGITGIGATELIYYPYWCLEKGYARFVGPDDQSPEWRQRARSWVHIMHLDARLAMLVYTTATVAFFILGSSVLHGAQQIPGGYDMVRTLSNLYTTTLGAWAYYLFLVGAFFVLYSTIFSANAANSRVMVDFLALVKAIRVENQAQRWRWQRIVVVALLTTYPLLHLMIGEPVMMVIIGGVAQAMMLPIIGFSTLYLRYKYVKEDLQPHFVTDVLLWLCSSLMMAFAIYNVITRLLR